MCKKSFRRAAKAPSVRLTLVSGLFSLTFNLNVVICWDKLWVGLVAWSPLVNYVDALINSAKSPPLTFRCIWRERAYTVRLANRYISECETEINKINKNRRKSKSEASLLILPKSPFNYASLKRSQSQFFAVRMRIKLISFVYARTIAFLNRMSRPLCII